MEEMNDYEEDDFEVEASSPRDHLERDLSKHEEEEEIKEEEEESRSNEVYMWGDDSRG